MKLWTIAQRKDETVHAFSGRFQTLLARLPHYDEEDMLERYIRALHPQLRMPVAQREPQTLSECIRLASHLELLTGTYMGRSSGTSEPQCRVAVHSTGKRRCAQPLCDVSTSLGATPAALVAPATSALVRGT